MSFDPYLPVKLSDEKNLRGNIVFHPENPLSCQLIIPGGGCGYTGKIDGTIPGLRTTLINSSPDDPEARRIEGLLPKPEAEPATAPTKTDRLNLVDNPDQWTAQETAPGAWLSGLIDMWFKIRFGREPSQADLDDVHQEFIASNERLLADYKPKEVTND